MMNDNPADHARRRLFTLRALFDAADDSEEAALAKKYISSRDLTEAEKAYAKSLAVLGEGETPA